MIGAPMPADAFGLPAYAMAQIIGVLSRQPEIQRVILFGSRAKGNYRAGSDVDLCLVAPDLTQQARYALESALDDLLLPWKIDLVLRHEIDNPDLLAHVDRVGQPFWSNQAA